MALDIKKQLKKNPFVLAPMDNVTDIGFRELCEKHNASYTISELTSVEALIRDKIPKYRYERGSLKTNCVQLFGSNEKAFGVVGEYVEDEADMIDVNFGCPSPTVTRNESGAKLLEDPDKVGKIIQRLCDNTNKPVSAKLRLGYKKENYIEVAKEIEDAGASLVTVHARLGKDGYSKKADWDKIKRLKESIDLPLIGNGDINSEKDVDRYLNEYADGIMIGRAAIGNPLIFERMQHYHSKGSKLEMHDIKKRQKELFIEYLRNIENRDMYKKEFKIKQQAMWFMKGIEGAKDLRVRICKLDNINDIIEEVNNF